MSLVDDLSRLVPGATVLPQGERAAAYEQDESGLGKFPPQAVVLARSAEEVAKILRYSRETRIPVVPRGAGSGKSGGALAERGGIILSLEKMDRIVEISRADMVCVVQPGVILTAVGRALPGTTSCTCSSGAKGPSASSPRQPSSSSPSLAGWRRCSRCSTARTRQPPRSRPSSMPACFPGLASCSTDRPCGPWRRAHRSSFPKESAERCWWSSMGTATAWPRSSPGAASFARSRARSTYSQRRTRRSAASCGRPAG
ncbi:MAG: FAD-binding oxidoreductase [Deltaproteobacteria bacterium]|nr:MAG: FAD-binding oxidoreductase [Deltaproteobacteria bacterium]